MMWPLHFPRLTLPTQRLSFSQVHTIDRFVEFHRTVRPWYSYSSVVSRSANFVGIFGKVFANGKVCANGSTGSSSAHTGSSAGTVAGTVAGGAHTLAGSCAGTVRGAKKTSRNASLAVLNVGSLCSATSRSFSRVLRDLPFGLPPDITCGDAICIVSAHFQSAHAHFHICWMWAYSSLTLSTRSPQHAQRHNKDTTC